MSNSNPVCLHAGRKTNFGFVGFLIVCMSLQGWGYNRLTQIEAVQSAVSRSARYLVMSTKDDGMFEYRINMDPTIAVQERYNILRHAGTIYAMSMYYQLQPDADMLAAIERAGRFLRDDSIHAIAGRDDMLAVWSDPEVNRTRSDFQAKLGGSGLGLVALLSLEDVHPGFTPLADLQSLGRFIVYMQKENGSFYSKYFREPGGRSDVWQSLYYPGEAALGLLMLYENDGSDMWLKSAANALAHLAITRKNNTDVPADHWALLATEKLFLIADDNELPVSRELLINHAIQICNSILQGQIENSERPEYDGGFSEDGRITPSATRLEGLQAALSFLPPNLELRKQIYSAVHRGISFLLRVQISEGEFIGAFPRAVAKIDRNAPNADNFNRRATEVRIDYVQHALSAMIVYLDLMNDEKQ